MKIFNKKGKVGCDTGRFVPSLVAWSAVLRTGLVASAPNIHLIHRFHTSTTSKMLTGMAHIHTVPDLGGVVVKEAPRGVRPSAQRGCESYRSTRSTFEKRQRPSPLVQSLFSLLGPLASLLRENETMENLAWPRLTILQFSASNPTSCRPQHFSACSPEVKRVCSPIQKRPDPTSVIDRNRTTRQQKGRTLDSTRPLRTAVFGPKGLMKESFRQISSAMRSVRKSSVMELTWQS